MMGTATPAAAAVANLGKGTGLKADAHIDTYEGQVHTRQHAQTLYVLSHSVTLYWNHCVESRSWPHTAQAQPNGQHATRTATP